MYLLCSSSCGLRRGSRRCAICAITLRLCFSCGLREEGCACLVCFAERDIFVTSIYDMFWDRALNTTVYHSRVYFPWIFSDHELLLYVDNCLLILVCMSLLFMGSNLRCDSSMVYIFQITSCNIMHEYLHAWLILLLVCYDIYTGWPQDPL